jgi:drug/metabolite transporter (DMT)-like permease
LTLSTPGAREEEARAQEARERAPRVHAPGASHRAGLAMAIAGAVAFSGKAIIIKLAYRQGTDAHTLLMLRMAMALPMFLVLAWWASRNKPPLRLGDWAAVVGLGFIGYYVSSLLDFLGLQYITASLERLILYLNPTLVALLGWLVFKRRVRPAQMAAMGLSYLGVLAVFGREVSQQGAHVGLGVALVFGSAVTYAVYLLYSGEVVKRLGSLRLTGLSASVACLFCILHYGVVSAWAGGVGSWQQVPAPVWWLSLLNAVACTVVPVLLVMRAIERIGSTLASQAGMVGPMATLVLGWAFLGEAITPWVIVGTMMVLAGVALQSRLATRDNAPSRKG